MIPEHPIKNKNVLNLIKDAQKEHPNDQDLGKTVREILRDLSEGKYGKGKEFDQSDESKS